MSMISVMAAVMAIRVRVGVDIATGCSKGMMVHLVIVGRSISVLIFSAWRFIFYVVSRSSMISSGSSRKVMFRFMMLVTCIRVSVPFSILEFMKRPEMISIGRIISSVLIMSTAVVVKWRAWPGMVASALVGYVLRLYAVWFGKTVY